MLRRVRATVFASLLLVAGVAAVTRVPSADGQFWDIQDTSPWAQDSGGIATGGRANPFNGFGYLKLQVRAAAGAARCSRNQYLRGFGLAHDGGERFDSITPVLAERHRRRRGRSSRRRTRTTCATSTRFTNTANEPRVVDVAWGGAAGAYRRWRAGDGGDDVERRSPDRSDGHLRDRDAERRGAWPTRCAGRRGTDRRRTCSARTTAGVLTRVGDMYGDPFVGPWPGFDPAHIGYVFTLTVATRPDRRADDVRRQGAERGLRSPRRLSRPDQGRLVAPKSGAVYRRRREDSGCGIRDRAGHRDGAPAGRQPRPARPDAAAARADRELARSRRPTPLRAVHGRREDRAANAGRDDPRRRDDVRGHRRASTWRGCRSTIATVRRCARCWR